MGYSNDAIAQAFVRHARYRIHARNLWYDGHGVIYSYDTPIASFVGKRGTSEERCLVGVFTAKGGGFISKTTSSHVNLVKKQLNRFAIPYEEMDGINFTARIERRKIAEKVANAIIYKRDLSWIKKGA